MSQEPIKLPKLSELPLKEGDPHHSAWGLYGKDDELGTLNRLTDEVVLRAAREEIRSGVRCANLFYDFYYRVGTISPVRRMVYVDVKQSKPIVGCCSCDRAIAFVAS
jgi:hypothetical protein